MPRSRPREGGIMRRAWRIGLSGLCLSWLALFGCRTPPVNLDPPKEVQKVSIPPANDLRYSKPPEYPARLDGAPTIKGPGTGGVNTPLSNRKPGMGGAGY